MPGQSMDLPLSQEVRDLPVYLLTACPDALTGVIKEILRWGARVVCVWAEMSGGPAPSFPDGVLDIALEPGCDIGARLGDQL